MTNIARLPQPGMGHERERIELAAALRWTARLDMHEGIANHYSLAVSDDGTKFLVNPYARHFSRMRASDMMLLDANDATTMQRPDPPDPTAWYIHGAIHRNVPHARCIMHVHPKYATVLATLRDSSMPAIDQNTMRFFGRIAVDEGFDGMGLGEEGERLSRGIGNKSVVVLGNHGVLVVGPTVAATFDELYYFERACQTLVTAYMTQKELRVVSDAVARKTAEQWLDYPGYAERHFSEIMAILDEEEPAYRT